MQNFVYLVGDPTTREAAVVDPAWDIDAIVEEAAAGRGLPITHALVTHFHPDHLGGDFMGHTSPGPPSSSRERPGQGATPQGRSAVRPPHHRSCRTPTCTRSRAATRSASATCRSSFCTPRAIRPARSASWSTTHLISGDTLFIGGCGRVDLPGSDPRRHVRQPDTTCWVPCPTTPCSIPGHNYAAASQVDHRRREAHQPALALPDAERLPRRDEPAPTLTGRGARRPSA